MRSDRARTALKRLGAAGVLFVLAKGLLWLALGAGLSLL